MNTRALGAAVACAALTLTLSACGDDAAEPRPAPTSPVGTPSPTASPSGSASPVASAPADDATASTAETGTDAPASGVPSPRASSAASWTPRPTPTTTDITEEMGPGAHDGDGE